MSKTNSVSLSTAKAWTANWRKIYPNQTKAFLIPVLDLIEALEEMDIIVDGSIDKNKTNACVRAYMALGVVDKETVEEKLLIVGTEKVGEIYKDIIKYDSCCHKEDEVIDDEIIGTGIYDFSHPCPPTCDPDSPLS